MINRFLFNAIASGGVLGAALLLPARWSATLQPSSGSDLNGSAQVEAAGSDSTRASISIMNAKPNAVLAWHIHQGRCGGNGDIVGAQSAYQPVRADGNGTGSSSATLPMALPESGEYSVSVHASDRASDAIISCGDLRADNARP
jgi:hypothetical protein